MVLCTGDKLWCSVDGDGVGLGKGGDQGSETYKLCISPQSASAITSPTRSNLWQMTAETLLWNYDDINPIDF